jgi:hypothetical protein
MTHVWVNGYSLLVTMASVYVRAGCIGKEPDVFGCWSRRTRHSLVDLNSSKDEMGWSESLTSGAN